VRSVERRARAAAEPAWAALPRHPSPGPPLPYPNPAPPIPFGNRVAAPGVDGAETLFTANQAGYGHPPMYDCTFSLMPTVESVRFSRKIVRGALARFDTDFVEAAAILTDELVANAIRHGEPPIVLDVKSDEDRLTVSVTDGGPGAPIPVIADPDAESGRGLMVIEKLSDTWGVSDLPKGKCVWFELAIKKPISH
jgi:anti-sigma regulatory factor (Ser/Thr protein kinase)